MTPVFAVYTKDNCQQCVATTRLLARKEVHYSEVPIEERPGVLAYAQERGWTSAPVVMVHDVTGQLVAAWSGFRPDKIKALLQRRAA